MSKLTCNIVEDIFDARVIDKDGKCFDQVSRVMGESESFKMNIILDYHSQLFQIKKGDKLRIIVTKSLLGDTMADADDEDACDETEEKLANSKMNEFDYVCYGKVYRIMPADSNNDPNRLKVYVSFGGLLMELTGEASNLTGFATNKCVYLMAKKLAF
uniref:DNA-directed RNA polymerases I, II, and III subunit RPABC3 n=1 Tax=Lepeophtheirus salmonis TaxID=72036 RepID=D3PJN0_LEPSM|nr:DNA-directed RNA polymerases I, II, and III subunit RPABC3 [Lepeophtheirus salmonis]